MLAADDTDELDDGREDADVVGTDAEEDEFAEPEGEEAPTDLDEFDAEAVADEIEEGDEDIDSVVELTSKEQSARSLEIRRAIERRMEERQLNKDVDYLDDDLDDLD